MKTNTTKEKILELLFMFPLRKFHLREISKILKISTPSISNSVKQLEKEKMVNHINQTKPIYEIHANFSSQKFKNMKRVHNLKSIYCSGFYDFLIENFPFSTIVLFGSYAKGDDTEKSDIDIFIDAKEKRFDLGTYEKKLNKKINIEFADFNKISKELKNSIANGIVLSGYMLLK